MRGDTVQARFQHDFKKTFVLTRDDVKKVWERTAALGLTVAATIHCSDGIIREFSSLDDLLAYENAPSGKITSLIIFGDNQRGATVAKVEFFEAYQRTVRASYDGEEAQLLDWKRGISDLVDGMLPWYRAIAQIDVSEVCLGAGLGLIGLSIVVPDSFRIGAAKSLLVSAGCILALGAVVLGVVFRRFFNRWFPVSTFALGQGVRRFEDDEKIRWGIIVALLIGIVGSIISAPLIS